MPSGQCFGGWAECSGMVRDPRHGKAMSLQLGLTMVMPSGQCLGEWADCSGMIRDPRHAGGMPLQFEINNGYALRAMFLIVGTSLRDVRRSHFKTWQSHVPTIGAID